MLTTENSPFLSGEAEKIRQRLGLTSAPSPVKVRDLDYVFENGVMATVRVTAERFNFALKLSDLGVVPANDNRKDKVFASIEAVLRNSQRGTLLPRDELWFEKDGKRIAILSPEITERRIRALFPARYDSDTKAIANNSYASWHAVPANGATFIPFTSWNSWNQAFQIAKADHLQTAQKIAENYERIRSASLRHYSEIAIDVYTRLMKTAPDRLIDANGENISLLSWVRKWRRFVSDAWPTREDILRRFTVEERFFWAPRPTKIQLDEDMMKYINDMDSRNWDDRQDEYQVWMLERNEIINRMWLDMGMQEQVDNMDERMAIMSIARQVNRTQKSQSHELAISYVRSIVERVESVFLNFLGNVRNNENGVSAVQINAILRVSEMLKVMSKDVDSLDVIRSQADLIEKYITSQQKQIEKAQQKKKDRMKATGDALSDLPVIIANAVNVIRQEAESIIGHDARRTHFSDSDPSILLDEIAATQQGQAGRVARFTQGEGIDDDGAPEIVYASPVPSSFGAVAESEDDMVVVRRLR